MKKILTIIAAFIALVAISINLYKLIQNDHKSNSRNSTITTIVSTTPTTYMKIVSTTLVIPINDKEKPVSVILKSQFEPDITLEGETQGNSWLLTKNGLILRIDLMSGENSPYSSDEELNVETLSTLGFTDTIYRVELDKGKYFYTDRYYKATCGEHFCSSGDIALKDGIYLEINCQTDLSDNLILCDQIISNLEIEFVDDSIPLSSFYRGMQTSEKKNLKATLLSNSA